MRYVAKDLGDAADLSAGKGNQYFEFVKLLFLALILIILLYFTAVFSSEYFISNITIEEEKRWFGKLSLEDFADVDSNSESDERVIANQILQQLVKDPSVPKLNYHLFIIDDANINAFAFPGGGIGITSGLLEAINDEIPLAFIIGHELGHFKYRHHLKGFSRALSINFVFSLFLGDANDLVITQNMLSLLESGHSQQQEIDSDLFSAKLIHDNYGTTENIEALFLILEQREKDKLSLPFLSTHPSSEERIHKLKSYTQQLQQAPL